MEDRDAADLEKTHRRRQHWCGATRPGAVSTLVVLILFVVLFQRQLLDDRQKGARSRANNVPGVESRELSSSDGASPASPVDSAGPLDPVDPGSRDGLFLGRVVDPRGRPVDGADVTIGQQAARTDGAGSFALPWAGGDLRVTHPGFWSRELKRSSLILLRELERRDTTGAGGRDAAGARLPVLLVPGARVSGTVRAAGEPASAARVLISTGQRRWEVGTEADGTFASPLLSASSLSLLVLHPGMLPHLTAPPPASDWNHRVEVSLRQGVPLSVRVENDRARPLGDAEVWLRTIPIARTDGEPSPVEWEFVGWTDDLGRLDAARANHRPAQIQVRTPGYAVTTRPLIGPANVVRLRPAPALTGTAVDAESGLPLELGSVRLQVSRDGAFVDAPDQGQQPHTLGGGRFIVGLPPFEGVYRVALRGAGNRAGASTGVRFDGTEAPAPFVVALDRRVVIAGCVRGDAGAIAGVPVELLSVPDAGAPARELHGVRVPPEARVVRSDRTDREGRFEFAQQGPGLYRVRVRVVGQLEYCSPIFCPPLDEELPIQLGPGATLSGTLSSAAGHVEADVPLVLTDGGAITRIAWTDGAGGYKFRDLPAGEYRLAIGQGAGRSTPRAVEVRELAIGGTGNLKFNLRRSALFDLGGD